MSESYFTTLKLKLFSDQHDDVFRTERPARARIFAFSEGFYNSYRRHVSLRQVSLAKFDARYYQKVRENGTTKRS